MKTTKTLALVALAALSLGIGSAMAQSEVPGNGGIDYWAGKANVHPASSPVVQSGASDTAAMKSGVDYTTLANPG